MSFKNWMGLMDGRIVRNRRKTICDLYNNEEFSNVLRYVYTCIAASLLITPSACTFLDNPYGGNNTEYIRLLNFFSVQTVKVLREEENARTFFGLLATSSPRGSVLESKIFYTW